MSPCLNMWQRQWKIFLRVVIFWFLMYLNAYKTLMVHVYVYVLCNRIALQRQFWKFWNYNLLIVFLLKEFLIDFCQFYFLQSVLLWENVLKSFTISETRKGLSQLQTCDKFDYHILSLFYRGCAVIFYICR